MKSKFEEQIKRILDNVIIISIVPSGRSGSYFVQSLLDNHENILNIPFDMGFGHIYNECSKFIKGEININQILNFVCHKSAMRTFFKENEPVHELWSITKVKINGKMVPFYIDTNKFIKNFSEVLKTVYKLGRLNEKGFYISLFIAFAQTIGKKIENIKYIIDQTHSYKSMKHLYEIDKNTKFIHTIRDPRASYYSYLEHNKSLNNGRKKSLPNYVNNTFSYTFYSLAKIERYRKTWLKKENYFSIRLEDLHESFDDVIKKLTLWLDIPIKKSLFKSTMGGYLWPCESVTHKRMIIGKDPTSNYPKWKDNLTKEQIRNIEFLASRFMDKQGYKKIYWKKEKKVLYLSILWILEQLKQIDIFAKDCSNNENIITQIKQLVVGRLKILYYILVFKPYKCSE